MGADIHMYIQYRDKSRINTDHSWWRDFGGRINPGRNYDMFSVLAGVRGTADKGFEPKGIPDFELSWHAQSSLYLIITEDGKDEDCCTLEQAESWGKPIIKNALGKPIKTLHPDLHSHSWLTVKELEQAYRWYKKESEYGIGLEYRVLLKIMKELEDKGKNEVVVVFWFDN